jgi:1,4-alpha-glucan branching enzyme
VGLSSSSIRAIVTGGHRDPFSVLGPHAEEAGGITVRAFLPEVREVTVVPGDGARAEHSLQRIHPGGLWEGTLPGGALAAYRLRVTAEDGRVREIEDVYRFPPTLSEYDLHLLPMPDV